MKKIIALGMVLLMGMAGAVAKDESARRYGFRQDTLKKLPKKVDVFQVIPHLSANDRFKSELVVRNNSTSPITITFDFYGEDGFAAEVIFSDSDGSNWQEQGFIATIQGLEVFSMFFDRVFDLNSFHIYAFADETESNYTLEAFYHLLDGNDKLATVGVPAADPGTNPVMNLDNTIDIDSGLRRFRGVAVTNFLDTNCVCDVWVYDDGANGANAAEGPFNIGTIQIPPSGKWLGTTYDLIPDINFYLPRGFGFVELNCDNPVSMLGLTFEDGSPIIGSVPVTYGTLNPFNLTKRKKPDIPK